MAAAGFSKPAAKFTRRSPLPKQIRRRARAARWLSLPRCAGAVRRDFPTNITCGTEGNKPKSPCADLNPRIHALFRLLEDADGWAKPFWLHSTVASQPPSISRTARCKSGEVTLDHW
jgi:hypothetical protein